MTAPLTPCPACKGSGSTMPIARGVCPHCKQGHVTHAEAQRIREEFARDTGLSVKELVARGWLI